MELFWKSICFVLIAVVLSAVLEHQKNFAVLVSVAAAVMTALTATVILRPVIDFMVSLEKISRIQGESLSRMLRALAVGYTAEIAGCICTDAGNASLAKSLHMIASIMILYISLPMFTRLIELLEGLLRLI